MDNGKRRALLVGIAGSHNAFSLSLYNLKGYAYSDASTRNDWEISVLQYPLIAAGREEQAERWSDLWLPLALGLVLALAEVCSLSALRWWVVARGLGSGIFS